MLAAMTDPVVGCAWLLSALCPFKSSTCCICAVWVHTDRSLKGLIGETAAHVSCLRAGDVSHYVYVESHHGCCWNGTRRGRKEDRSGEGRSPASRYCGKRASSLSRYLRCQAHVERGDREDNKNCPYNTPCHKHSSYLFFLSLGFQIRVLAVRLGESSACSMCRA